MAKISKSKISKQEAEKLVKAMMPVREMSMNPKSKGVISKQDLVKDSAQSKKRVKAVLFIPEDAAIRDDLRIEVVGIRKAMLLAMVARRC